MASVGSQAGTSVAPGEDGRGAWLPQFIRFQLIGPVGFSLGWLEFRLIWWSLSGLEDQALRAGLSWLGDFVIGILWTLQLHRMFTFRDTVQLPYLQALWRMYLTYALSAGLGTLMIAGLVGPLGSQEDLAYFGVKMVTSALNFVAIRQFSLVLGRAEVAADEAE